MSGTQSLLDLIKAFDAASIPYMIVGSYSSNYYGIPRLTKDVDLDKQRGKRLASRKP